eukprot:GFUD01014730.1.p1 GENE.GFUD01014730.1~~GFUD01014730.1.p1  ORF type:complete len:125 (+),score=29.63 GFUD01014730.1:67-441(+)
MRMGRCLTVEWLVLFISLVRGTSSLQCYSCTVQEVLGGQCDRPGVTLVCDDEERSCVKQWRDGEATSWQCSLHSGADSCKSETGTGQVRETTCYCSQDRCNYADRVHAGGLLGWSSVIFILIIA